MNSTPTGSDEYEWDGYELFTLEEWDEALYYGYVIHGVDGVGYWIAGDKNTDVSVSLPKPEGTTGVVWYNK